MLQELSSQKRTGMAETVTDDGWEVREEGKRKNRSESCDKGIKLLINV